MIVTKCSYAYYQHVLVWWFLVVFVVPDLSEIDYISVYLHNRWSDLDCLLYFDKISQEWSLASVVMCIIDVFQLSDFEQSCGPWFVQSWIYLGISW